MDDPAVQYHCLAMADLVLPLDRVDGKTDPFLVITLKTFYLEGMQRRSTGPGIHLGLDRFNVQFG